MKLSHIITLLIAAFLITGCASNETASSSEEVAPAAGSATTDEGYDQKAAYDGSSLLMERYKAGQIEGYRD